MNNKTNKTEITKEQLVLEYLQLIIEDTKFENNVYLAGGAVRDELIGVPVKDIDLLIAQHGSTQFAEFVCKRLGIYKENSNPVIYENYGTAKFNLNNIIYKEFDLSSVDIECVIPRVEKYYEESRNPEIKEGSIYDDAFRRDFTINSLLKNLTTGEILDLTGLGVDDIKNGIVRTALEPSTIFSDDPLRMLRAIRFALRYNWKLPLSIIRAIKENAHRLEIISKERINIELSKMLLTDFPSTAIRLIQFTGLSKYIFPELDLLIGLTQNKHHHLDAMNHTLLVLKNTPKDLVTRLSALFHDIGKFDSKSEFNGEIHFYGHEDVGSKITVEVLKRLRYPNEVVYPVVKLVKNHMRLKSSGDSAEMSNRSLRKLRIEIGEHLEEFLDLVHADNIAHKPESNLPNQIPIIRERLSRLEKFETSQHVKLPITGKELIDYTGIPQGILIGQMMKSAEHIYLEDPEIDKETLLERVKEWNHHHIMSYPDKFYE